MLSWRKSAKELLENHFLLGGGSRAGGYVPGSSAVFNSDGDEV